MNSEVKALVVDDEPGPHSVLVDYCQAIGLNTQSAYNKDTALNRLHTERFDIVITDLNLLQGGEGWIVTTTAKSLDPSTKVICVTNKLPGDQALAVSEKIGADACFSRVDNWTEPFSDLLMTLLTACTVTNAVGDANRPVRQSSLVLVSDLKYRLESTFVKHGLSLENARVAADVLIYAEHEGKGQGLDRLFRVYLPGLASGRIVPNAQLRMVNRQGTTSVWDGGRGLGIAFGPQVADYVVETALREGTACAALRNTSSIGPVSYAARKGIAKGTIIIISTNGHPAVVPPGAREAVLGTSPLLLAIPGDENGGLVAESGSSRSSIAEIEQRAKRHEHVPRDLFSPAALEEMSLSAKLTDQPIPPELAIKMIRRLEATGGNQSDQMRQFALRIGVDALLAATGGKLSRDLEPGEASTFYFAIRADPITASGAVQRIREVLKNVHYMDSETRLRVPGSRFTKQQHDFVELDTGLWDNLILSAKFVP